MPTDPQKKIEAQVRKAGLPTGGTNPFRPRLATNSQGNPVVEKQAVATGPKSGKRGYVDDQGRIWIRDRAHSNVPERICYALTENRLNAYQPPSMRIRP